MTTMTPPIPDVLAAAVAGIAARDAAAEEAAAATMLPPGIAANALELDRIRIATKTMKEREAVLRASVLAYLDNADVDSATDGRVTVSKSEYERENIDKSRLEALYPNVLRQVLTKTPVKQIRVKIKG